jgi:hypothetical protein
MSVHLQIGPRMLVFQVVLQLSGEPLQVRKVGGLGRAAIDVCEGLLQRGEHDGRFCVRERRHDRPWTRGSGELLVVGCFRCRRGVEETQSNLRSLTQTPTCQAFAVEFQDHFLLRTSRTQVPRISLKPSYSTYLFTQAVMLWTKISCCGGAHIPPLSFMGQVFAMCPLRKERRSVSLSEPLKRLAEKPAFEDTQA